MYTMIYTSVGNPQSASGCWNVSQMMLTKIDPTGNVTYTCVTEETILEDPVTFSTINTEINNILSQGYKLVYVTPNSNLIDGFGYHEPNIIWYFAIP